MISFFGRYRQAYDAYKSPTTPPSGWDGRPLQGIPFGDSRTANEGFDGAGGETTGWRTKLENLANQGDGSGHHNIRKDSGYPSEDTDFALNAVSDGGFFSSRRDSVTYYKQIVYIWFTINGKKHNPDRTVEYELNNLAQITAKIAAMGFLPVLVTEPNSTTRTDYPQFFTDLNAGIRTNYRAWGGIDFVDLDGQQDIANMADRAISPDDLHFADLGNTYLAGHFLLVHNRIATSLGVPNSGTNSGGGMVTPAPPTLDENVGARTITATAGNGLPSSALRYRIKNGSAQTGSVATLDPAAEYAPGDVVFYSVATGNYTQSPSAASQEDYPLIYTAILRNSRFLDGPVADDSTGWRIGNQFNDGRQRVEMGGGICEYKGILYDYIHQRTRNQIMGRTYRITVVVDSQSGGDLILKTEFVNSVNLRWSTPGTYTADYVAQFAAEGFDLGAEGNTVALISFFDIQLVG